MNWPCFSDTKRRNYFLLGHNSKYIGGINYCKTVQAGLMRNMCLFCAETLKPVAPKVPTSHGCSLIDQESTFVHEREVRCVMRWTKRQWQKLRSPHWMHIPEAYCTGKGEWLRAWKPRTRRLVSYCNAGPSLISLSRKGLRRLHLVTSCTKGTESLPRSQLPNPAGLTQPFGSLSIYPEV